MAFRHHWLLAAQNEHDPGRLELCPTVQKRALGRRSRVQQKCDALNYTLHAGCLCTHRARRATGSLKVSPRGRRAASVATAPPTRSLQGKVHAFEYTNQTIRPHNNLELCGDPAAALKTSQTLEQGRTQSASPPGAHKLGGRVARCGWLVY